MEECLDQDVEVLQPAPQDATFVNRATSELATRHGPSAIVSLPLRRGGEVTAVVTAERGADRPFQADEIESLRLTADLCTARLSNLYQSDRWFGARAAEAARKGLALLVGPKHTWIKLGGIAVLALVVFLTFVTGRFRVSSPFRLEATTQQVVAAPFNGILESVKVRPNDLVDKGDLLATLRTEELRIKLGEKQAERESYRKQADEASAKDERAKAQIAEAQAEGVAWQIDELKYYIEQARIVAPIKGRILTGDLERQIGAPVEQGNVLFEVGSAESLRAELSVPEEDIAEVLAAMAEADKAGRDLPGELATASHPARKISFRVERINPVAEVVDQRNVFKVRVELLGGQSILRPGMEGVAKVEVGRRTYGWMATRKLVNWLRMKLWW